MARPARVAVRLLLSGAFLLAAAALPVGAEDIQVDLGPGETFSTSWIRVPAGQEVLWRTLDGEGFVEWGVDARPYGELAAGDGAVGPGCALATEDFEARLRVGNTLAYNLNEAHFVVRFAVRDAEGGCPAAPELARQRAEEVAGTAWWPDQALLFGVAMTAATGLVAALAFVSAWRLWRKKPAWGDLPPEEPGGGKPPSRRSP